MELASFYVSSVNEALVWAKLSHEMGHLHGGLAIYVVMQTLLRTRRASGIALQAVFGCEIVNEILQRMVYGDWRWADTLGDVALTIFWPTMLYALGKYRRARWNQVAARKMAAVRAVAQA